MIKQITQTYAEAVKTNNENVQKLENIFEKALDETCRSVQKAVAINESAQKLIAKNHALNEVELRRNNAILYGIEEQENITAIRQVEELMRLKLYLRCPVPAQAFRLGRKLSNRPRPIKLHFQDESFKWDFIKRTNSKDTRNTGIF